jgi:membrane protease YdiL (CAAX protease family)
MPETTLHTVDRPQVQLDKHRIGLFLLLAFGIAWTLYAIIYLTGGIADSRTLIPGTPITVAIVLMTLSMWSPALANIFTRLLTREGRHDLWLRPRLRIGWPYWLLMWVLPALLALLGAALYFAIFPDQFDPDMQSFRDQVEALTGEAMPIPAAALVALQLLQAVLLAPALNAIATFGEEFGWRAYLQQKLMPLGIRRAMIAMGLIWGVWHWPVIAMGYNFGDVYPGAPWLGMLAMVWFAFVVGTVLGWTVIRAGSIWPAIIGHGALNGIAAVGLLFVAGEPYALLGPTSVGLIGGIGWAILALSLLLGAKWNRR